MPRASDGSYSLPAGSLVNVGEDIIPSQHNPPLQDMAQALTGSLSRDGSGGMRTNLNMGGFRVINASPGVQPTDLVIMGQISSNGGAPVGSVIDFAGSSVPTGWLICAGQVLSRSDYADLFAAIGTAYGAPSGSTFNLPDCRGRVTAGMDTDQGGFADRLTSPNSRTLGATGGAQNVILTSGQMPKHTHAVTGDTSSSGAHQHGYLRANNIIAAGSGAGSAFASGNVAANTDSAGAHTHTISVSAADAGADEAHPNVQPTIIFSKIIKASNG